MSSVTYMLIAFFVILPLVAIWCYCLFHIVARPDLKLWQKFAWGAGILVLPIIGAIAYLIAWKQHGPIDDTALWEDKSAEEIEEAVWQSENMTSGDRFSHTRLQ